MSVSLVFEKFTVNGADVFQNPVQVNMTQNVAVIAHYVEENGMGTVTFNGTVNAQAGVGEVVTITVTKPDNTKVTLTAPTDANKAFIKAYTDVAGDYSAVASVAQTVDADNIYSPATSPIKAFTIVKMSVVRTITLVVA